MTYEEIINEVHDEATISLDGYTDEDYIIIMKGLVKRFENDIECVEQEINFHKHVKSKEKQEDE